jgi:hypothetical protein
MKKYEIYLPLKYNDGKEIEPHKIELIRNELAGTFGAITVSAISAPFQGNWAYAGVEYVDDIIKVEIITKEDPKTTLFLASFKQRLKQVLQQHEILITVHDIKLI